MTATELQFQPMLSTVIGSQQAEVTLGKQPVTAEYGQGLRNVLSALPSEVSKALMSEYRAPDPQLVAQMESGIASREMAGEHAAHGQNLDQGWLAGGGLGASNAVASTSDDWNIPKP